MSLWRVFASLTLISDLRAVLRLQHSNTEALAEILALCPLEAPPIEHPVASGSSSSQPSSSAAPPTHNHIWIPTPKASKPLPFPRSPTDDRKLKISTIPITVEIPVDLPLFAPAAGASSASHKMGAEPPPGRTVKQTFSYPTWERYLVKKVSD